MNHIIKSQLESCKVADIPRFDETTTHIEISKVSEMTVSPYQIHKFYLVELADFILFPAEDSILADNWNNGTTPQYKYYKAEISQVVGKMIRITGCGYDMNSKQDTLDIWDGWVPQQGIKLIQEL